MVVKIGHPKKLHVIDAYIDPFSTDHNVVQYVECLGSKMFSVDLVDVDSGIQCKLTLKT